MNCETGQIVEMTSGLMSELKDAGELHKYVPIEQEDLPKVRNMSMTARKNWMRNKPCPCGSDKKFKKCCWQKCSSQRIKSLPDN